MVGRSKKKPSRRSSREPKRKPRKKVLGRTKSRKKKVVLLVIDGLADTPQVRSGREQTPLSAAKKPNTDWLASRGAVGELSLAPAKRGTDTYPTSHTANVALLGYDPKRYYLQRGPLEAVGVDIPYKEGHLALRCNFATVTKNKVTGELTVTDRRAARSDYGLDEIARFINQHVKLSAGGPVEFVFTRTYGHRAVLVIKERLSDQISTNDPNENNRQPKRIEALDSSELSARTAAVVQEFIDATHNVIEYHPKNAERMNRGLPPANYIIVREPGIKLVALPNFTRKWKMKRAVCISENGVMKATCMLAGFSSVTVPEFDPNGSPNASLDFVFENIESALAEYDFIYAHIKPADEAGHDGDFERKKRVIETIDKKLESFRGFDGVLVVTCDHITSCEHRKHMPGSVPVLVYGRKRSKAEKIKTFNEFSAKKGSLKKLGGRQLWKYVFGK